jgi:hypothetical protein
MPKRFPSLARAPPQRGRQSHTHARVQSQPHRYATRASAGAGSDSGPAKATFIPGPLLRAHIT